MALGYHGRAVQGSKVFSSGSGEWDSRPRCFSQYPGMELRRDQLQTLREVELVVTNAFQEKGFIGEDMKVSCPEWPFVTHVQLRTGL